MRRVALTRSKQLLLLLRQGDPIVPVGLGSYSCAGCAATGGGPSRPLARALSTAEFATVPPGVQINLTVCSQTCCLLIESSGTLGYATCSVDMHSDKLHWWHMYSLLIILNYLRYLGWYIWLIQCGFLFLRWLSSMSSAVQRGDWRGRQYKVRWTVRLQLLQMSERQDHFLNEKSMFISGHLQQESITDLNIVVMFTLWLHLVTLQREFLEFKKCKDDHQSIISLDISLL